MSLNETSFGGNCLGPVLDTGPRQGVRCRSSITTGFELLFQVGGIEESLSLLVELCACEPWGQVKDHPRLAERAREQFLGRLSVDLPGETDEDDIEYIDEYLKEGRNLGGWSTARWAVVIGGGVLITALSAGIGAFLIAGEAAVAAGGAAAAAAIAAARARRSQARSPARFLWESAGLLEPPR